MSDDKRDKIEKFLDIAPANKTKVELPADINEDVQTAPSQEDYEFARSNQRKVVEQGMELAAGLSELAVQSNDPDIYAVAVQMFAAMSRANEALLNINVKNTNIKTKTNDKIVNHTTNVTNIKLTSSEMLAQALEAVKKSQENNGD